MSEMENIVKINECCDILDNNRVPINDEVRQTIPGNIPYYGANGIQGYINKFIFDEELILMAEDGGNFEQYDTRPIAYKINGKSWVNNHAHILRAKKGFVQDYIFYSLAHKNILKYIKGGTRSKLNKSELEKIEIKFPEHYPTQRKIAHILSTADAVIEKTQTAIAKYKAIKQGMLHDLFTRGIDTKTGKLRPKYEDAPEFYKESKIGIMPQEWKELIFDEIIKSVDSGWSPNCLVEPASLGEWGSLKTTSVTWAGYNPNENKKLPLNIIPRKETEVNYNDILITRVGPRARVGVVVHVNDRRKRLMVSDNMLRFKMNKNEKIFLPFLALFLGSQFVQSEWQKRIAGLAEAQVVINQQIIKKTIIVLPKEKEQKAIYEKLYSIMSKIQTEQNYLHKLQQIKAGLMADLLSGKKEVIVDEEVKN
jgi:type I restriction enzyme, S subunit